MKPYKIIRVIAALCTALSVASCAEDKCYDLGGWGSNKVNFTATNLALDSTVHIPSTSLDWYSLNQDIKEYPLTLYLPHAFDGDNLRHDTFIAQTERMSEIWSGGYNEIEITFAPTAPEETEATFTMPDGTTITATAERPTIRWTPDSTFKDKFYSGDPEYNHIKAESRYTRGNNQYYNTGYIYVQINPDIRFNNIDKKWYNSYWVSGKPISVESYVKFTVENLTVGSKDRCVSSNSQFPETIIERKDTVSIPFIGYEGNHRIREEILTGNDFLMLGNTDVKFTFIPQYGQEEMTISLPDGSNHLLTMDNPSFVWSLTPEEVRGYYYYRTIYGQSTYTKNGLTFDCSSEVTMRSMDEIWYDPDDKVFRSDYWW